MNILVTGAAGFVGQNLRIRLSREKDCTVFPFDVANTESDLFEFLANADRIVHLAGINRSAKSFRVHGWEFGAHFDHCRCA